MLSSWTLVLEGRSCWDRKARLWRKDTVAITRTSKYSLTSELRARRSTVHRHLIQNIIVPAEIGIAIPELWVHKRLFGSAVHIKVMSTLPSVVPGQTKGRRSSINNKTG